MILLIDNYDSFSYNLYQLAGSINPDIHVARNNKISIDNIIKMNPTHIIISPGPGHPKNAGICEEVVDVLKGKIPILGVCLGHQCICESFGSHIVHASELMHGKPDLIMIDNSCNIFNDLPDIIIAARYHSLVAEKTSIPTSLKVIGHTSSGEVMAVGNEDYCIYGVQFHPESILTSSGKQIMYNFLRCSI